MKYFSYLPKIEYSDNLATNLMVRGKIVQLINEKSILFYNYRIKDSDRPDLLSEFYYGNSDYTWILFYANEIYDPIHQWPLFYSEFNSHINKKYGNGQLLVKNSPNISFNANRQSLISDNENEIKVLSSLENHQYIQIENSVANMNEGVYSIQSTLIDNGKIEVFLKPEATIEVTIYDRIKNQLKNQNNNLVTLSYERPERVVKFFRYVNDLIIDKDTYLQLPEELRKAESVYTWEENVNDSKRFIRIVESKYLGIILNNIKTLF